MSWEGYVACMGKMRNIKMVIEEILYEGVE
jgi:hypothetical protein